jgi:hypothetical protein
MSGMAQSSTARRSPASGFGLARALALALALIASGSAPPAGAQEVDLLEEVERAVRRRDAEPGGRIATPFAATDMYGKAIDLAHYRGSAVVLTFLSPACYKEAIAWLKGVQTSFLGDREIVFINVLYPGPTPAFSSRAATARRLRARIEEFYADVRDRMSPAEQRSLERTEIRWIVDWRRELYRRYDVAVDRVHLVLIDRSGRIREEISRRSPETERRLADTLEAMRRRARE